VPGGARTRVLARFLALTGLLGLIGGPLGGQLLLLNGQRGLAGWQWLFLLEAIPSVLFAFVVLIVMPDVPARATWLTQEEKDWIAERVTRETEGDHRVQHVSFRVALSDPRIVLMCLIFFSAAVGGNMVGFFGPQLIKSRSGWSDSAVATISVIPALVGAISMVLAAGHSDRSGDRKRHVVIGYGVAALGYLLCAFAPTGPATIGALSLNALGERIAAGSYWALTSNLLGRRAAAGGIAFINSVGNLGGFFGPVLMGRLNDSTHGSFKIGLFVATVLFCLSSLIARLLTAVPRTSTPPATA
jgi:ACS family tartrate transporter-like MFS transporter